MISPHGEEVPPSGGGTHPLGGVLFPSGLVIPPCGGATKP